MIRSLGLFAAVLFLAGVGPRLCLGHSASDSVKEDSARAELRALRDQLVAAVNGNDIDKLLPLLDDNVVVTFLNAEVAHGPAEVKAYLDRMTGGDSRPVKSFQTDPRLDEPAQLYGSPPNTAIAAGSSSDACEMSDGWNFTIQTRWSATLVKKQGTWKLACFQVSASPFDNPILGQTVQRTTYLAGSIAAGTGLLLGLLLPLVFRRKRSRFHLTGATGA